MKLVFEKMKIPCILALTAGVMVASEVMSVWRRLHPLWEFQNMWFMNRMNKGSQSMARSWMMALVFAALFAAWPGGQVMAVKAYDKELTARYVRDGRVQSLLVRISDGEVVAVLLDKEDLPRGGSGDEEGRGWRYVAPRATIERSDPLKDGELAEKYRHKARIRIGDGYRGYLTVFFNY